MLKFKINGQKIIRVDGTYVVADSYNYLHALFEFSDEWNGLTKTAVFKNRSIAYTVILNNNECVVPHETLKEGVLQVSVYGGELITADCAEVFVHKSGYVEGQAPLPPTPTVYEQIMNILSRLAGGTTNKVLAKASSADYDFKFVDNEGGGGESHPFVSLERLHSYLYRVTFDEIPVENNVSMSYPIGGCSSFVLNGKVYRSFDWNYSNALTFNIVCKGFEGTSLSDSITEDNLDGVLIGQLPYRMLDGRNDYGIVVTTHVLYNDWDWHGSGNIPLYKIPYLILSQIKTLDNFEEQMEDILANVVNPAMLDNMGYLLQFLVSDGTTTYAILPPTENSGSYVVENITSNPKLTNFRWVNSQTVTRSSLQIRPTGVERWNLIPCGLEDLRFTKAYEAPTRLSEFIGINETTKFSSDTELELIYDSAHDLYMRRERDGQTWQSVHAVVYSDKGLEQLYVQENYVQNFGTASSSEGGGGVGIMAFSLDAETGVLSVVTPDSSSGLVFEINENGHLEVNING